ncbi:MAG: radical SAM protein, partial [bacterium]
MLKDSFGRIIDYLRVSITDHCNLRCIYCKPFLKKEHREMLRLEEIIEIIKTGYFLGIRKARITGGEPLIRRGLKDFFYNISKIDNMEFSLTTNGIFLSDYLSLIKDCGISRINISLSSLVREKYKEITGFDELDRVIKGIEMAKKNGFFIKVNMVCMKGINNSEIM